MDARVIKPFIVAVQRVFETMVHTRARVGKPVLRTDASPTYDVSGVIGFSGDALGCVVLSFPTHVACSVATAFAGTPIDQHHPDFADAIGELTNMVAGSAKAEFDGINISISLPSVITGRGHTLARPKQTPRIGIPCETDFGPVFVEVGMTMSDVPVQSAAGADGAPV